MPVMPNHGVAGRQPANEHGGPDDPLHRYDLQKKSWIVAFSSVGTAHERMKCAAIAEIEGAHLGHPWFRAPPLLESIRIAPGPPNFFARCSDETHDLKIQLRVTHLRVPPAMHLNDRIAPPPSQVCAASRRFNSILQVRMRPFFLLLTSPLCRPKDFAVDLCARRRYSALSKGDAQAGRHSYADVRSSFVSNCLLD